MVYHCRILLTVLTLATKSAGGEIREGKITGEKAQTPEKSRGKEPSEDSKSTQIMKYLN